MSEVQTASRNYLVPADGTTHTVASDFVASSQPYVIRWKDFSVNNFNFYPQGAYIDNRSGLADLQITIGPVGYLIVVAAGAFRAVSFPAPSSDQTATITGMGAAKIYWVDFPVFPDSENGSGTSSVVTIDPTTLPLSVTNTALSESGDAYIFTQRPFQRSDTTLPVAVTDVATASLQFTANAHESVRICNAGTVAVAVVFGSAAIGTAPTFPVAPTARDVFVILPSVTETFFIGVNTAGFLRAICAAGNSTTLYVCAGFGA